MFKKSVCILILSFLCMSTCYGASSGFKETGKVKYGEDTLHTYSHEKSGLELIWIQNKDNLRSFTLGVRTPTTNSTGVNHIIEHTLFTGCKKYPSSSLFFDASEAYPATYMNALTSGDMTIFPFATPYMTSYKALLDIYLDSIFEPSLLEQPYGFYEEAFHYDPEESRCAGVVYNEMKGAYGSIERNMYRQIRESVYKDTIYAYDSGGDPNEIPRLTYEACLETYQKYYYPANMKIILYGDLPIKEILTTIDTYLTKSTNDLVKKEPISLKVDTLSLTNKTKEKGLPQGEKACIIKSFVIKKQLSTVQIAQLDLWVNTYLVSPHAYFEKALQKLELYHVKVVKDDDLPYPIYSIVVQDVPRERVEETNQLLETILSNIPKDIYRDEALEKDTVEKAQWIQLENDNSKERGIDISQSLLEAWAHDKEMYQYYIRKNYLEKVKALDKEEIAHLLKTAKSCTTILLPGTKLIEDPLTLTSIGEEKWESIIKAMGIWQKQKETLTPIALNQLITKPRLTTKVVLEDHGATLVTKVKTGMARSQLYYSTAHIKEKELPYMFLYSYLLEESAKEERPFKGILEMRCTAFQNEEGYSPMLKLTVLTKEEETNHGELFIKARESLLSKDQAWYKQKLIQLVTRQKEANQNNVLGALSRLGLGSETGIKRYLYEQGYPFYKWCEALREDETNNWVSQIKRMDTYLYNTEGLVRATALPNSFKNPYAASWEKVLISQPQYPIKEVSYNFKTHERTSVLEQETAVDYIYLQYTIPERTLDGTDYLTAAYLTKQYLSPMIRVRLGAYGAGCNVQYPRTTILFTYRDPDYRVSMAVLKGIPDFLEKPIEEARLLTSKAEALTKVHNQFKLLSADMEQADALEYQMMLGMEEDAVTKLQYEIVEATVESIRSKRDLFLEVLKKGSLSIATKTPRK